MDHGPLQDDGANKKSSQKMNSLIGRWSEVKYLQPAKLQNAHVSNSHPAVRALKAVSGRYVIVLNAVSFSTGDNVE